MSGDHSNCSIIRSVKILRRVPEIGRHSNSSGIPSAKTWCEKHPKVGRLVVLFYSVSTLFGSFNAESNFKPFSLV